MPVRILTSPWGSCAFLLLVLIYRGASARRDSVWRYDLCGEQHEGYPSVHTQFFYSVAPANAGVNQGIGLILSIWPYQFAQDREFARQNDGV